MKKLFFGLLLAICTMTFSAFTAKQNATVLTNYWALNPDGKYYRLASYDQWTDCEDVFDPVQCVVKWTHMLTPNTNVLPGYAMEQFIRDGLAHWDGDLYYRYIW